MANSTVPHHKQAAKSVPVKSSAKPNIQATVSATTILNPVCEQKSLKHATTVPTSDNLIMDQAPENNQTNVNSSEAAAKATGTHLQLYSTSVETIVPDTQMANSPFNQKIPSPCHNRNISSNSQSLTLSKSVDENDWDGRPLAQYRSEILGRSHHFTRARLHNKYSPLGEHLFDDDGDGESWNQFSDEEVSNTEDNHENSNGSMGFYSPAGSSHFIAVQRPPSLNVSEALNWGNMAEEAPFQSWEARADEEFNFAMAKIDENNGCIQLEHDDRSSILEQDFPPLQKSHFPKGTSIPPASKPCLPSESISTSSNAASHSATASNCRYSESLPSPIKTRAQRQKNATALSHTKQQKMKKAANREIEALSRIAKSKTTTSTPILDPDEVWWQICINDIKKRENYAKAAAKAPPPEERASSSAGNL